MKRKGSCQICYEAFTRKVKPLHLPCNCWVCCNCLSDLVREQCKDYSNVDFCIVCPSDVHKAVLSPSLLKSLLSKRDFRSYESTAIQRLLRDPAYRQCPRCHLIAWTNATFCLSNPSCPNCYYTWLSSLSSLLISVTDFTDNLPSIVLKDLLASPCPHCLIYISKASGCDHMTCSYCKFEFCWLCSHPYSTHSEIHCATHCLLLFFWVVTLLVLFLLHITRVYASELYHLAPYIGLLMVIIWIPYYFGIVLPDLISEMRGVSKGWKYGSIAGFVCFGVVAGLVELMMYFSLLMKLLVAVFVSLGMSAAGLGLFWLRFTERL